MNWVLSDPVSRLLTGVIDRRRQAILDLGQEVAVSLPARVFNSNKLSAMALLRRRLPILRIGASIAVVARRDDVLAVLEDQETFVTPYAGRLPVPFVLGFEGQQLQRQRDELRDALPSGDKRWLRELALTKARQRVAKAQRDGVLDVGTDLVYPVLNDVVADYLGTPRLEPDLLVSWARDIFEDIFLNPADLPLIHDRSELATRQMSAALDDTIRDRAHHSAEQTTPGPRGSDDVLGRLLAGQSSEGAGLSDPEIRDNLIGLAIGWLWHGAKAAIIAVDQLLTMPEQLAAARAAASAADLDRLGAVLWEVLRFRPVQVGVPRICTRDTTLAEGTSYATKIRRGAFVLAGTHSAMWDDSAVPDPGTFDASRPWEQYVIFGHGPHRCLGEDIMRAQLPGLLAPLLEIDGLERDRGSRGRVRWVGPSPDGFRVRLLA